MAPHAPANSAVVVNRREEKRFIAKPQLFVVQALAGETRGVRLAGIGAAFKARRDTWRRTRSPIQSTNIHDALEDKLRLCHFSNVIDSLDNYYKNSKLDLDLNKSNEPAEEAQEIRAVRVQGGEIDSRELFQSERELLIRHEGSLYRLRLTSLNKLILTK
jgi:hemin uptake protein HemP